ncbi:hypothetical protein O3M35_012341 [Rhynocoris fuscipes]|uniref:Coenzyme Q-binding protein COQ10 START domain-containing protein n=1 Tax=Rhynocoris fuscipes TaxID=488301 RepID=A0AAW1CZE3_9HEMI
MSAIVLKTVINNNFICNKYETKMRNSLEHLLRKSSCILITLRGLSSRKKEYSESKIIGYSREQMFEVVADVENYEKFVPFCLKSDVTRKSDNELFGILEVGFPPLVESYTSKVTLVRPYLVKADCTDGKLFNHLTTTWRFSDLPKVQYNNNRNNCKVNFYLSFEFKSLLHSQLANLFFDQLVLQMQSAFFKEASRRYGVAYLTTKSDAPTT